jgi:phage baseplate assembly protein gpV
MESKNRSVWIVVIVVLVVVCICAAVALLVAAGWLSGWSFDWDRVTSYERERIEQTFEVSDTPTLEIDSFAGNVTIRAGEGRVIQVVATKRTSRRSDMERIEIEMTESGAGLVIKTRKPAPLSNASVDLEITTPAGTRLDAHTGAGSVHVQGLTGDVQVDTGAGSVDMRDVKGDIDAHSGAGSIDVLDGTGVVRLDTGAGSIEYQGTPEGDCRFESGAGSITLRLPSDLNVEVDLGTGVGDIDLAFAVDGRVTRREVEGVIGSGDQGSIYAHTGTGSIHLERW